jgi:hypothetical protein
MTRRQILFKPNRLWITSRRGFCLTLLVVCALTTSLFHLASHITSKSRKLGRKPAQHYPPALYPQVVGVASYSHNTTWYAISAYMDMRPQAFGAIPSLTFLSAGPSEDVKTRRSMFARVFLQRNGAFVVLLECLTTGFDGAHHHDTQHAVTSVVCSTGSSWHVFKRLAEEPLGACLVHDSNAYCDNASIVPIGTPPNYPGPLLPQEKIALCVPGVRKDIYSDSFRFFTQYYRSLGVDTIYVYMARPGYEIAREIENAAAEGGPEIVILPWCLQRGACYRCTPGQPIINNTRWFGFAGTNFAQLLAHQDCLYRAIGSFRWVVFVDLDEYIVPMTSHIRNLHELASASYPSGDDPPAEIVINSAFYESCLPDQRDKSTVPLSPDIDSKTLPDLPMPLWSAARVSEIYTKGAWRSKFMCDPLRCDRLGVHFTLNMFCQRYTNVTTTTCKSVEAPINTARLHHARARRRNPNESTPRCSEVNGIQEIDWSLTNRAIKIIRSGNF